MLEGHRRSLWVVATSLPQPSTCPAPGEGTPGLAANVKIKIKTVGLLHETTTRATIAGTTVKIKTKIKVERVASSNASKTAPNASQRGGITTITPTITLASLASVVVVVVAANEAVDCSETGTTITSMAEATTHACQSGTTNGATIRTKDRTKAEGPEVEVGVAVEVGAVAEVDEVEEALDKTSETCLTVKRQRFLKALTANWTRTSVCRIRHPRPKKRRRSTS
eukprot:TRINITY_DN115393_c0_g1_i1.p2 TRINITY_DN115393_c0_g1~~TRINITY_DN115393_c0_g1_i1.p2  ORF type:complete len:224 (+),score=22.44 TRINITY_DN115393_c0_g1_i1:212-883(+)